MADPTVPTGDQVVLDHTRSDHTFVLRIRTDSQAAVPLRATIRHMPSGAELSTADLTEVDDFIRLRLYHGK